MKKLIITDVDNTLVPEGTTNINPEYFTVLRKLHEKGYCIVIASGRHLTSLKKMFAPIYDFIWITAQNGAVIAHGDKTTTPYPMPTEWGKEFWAELSTIPDIESILYTENYCHIPFANTAMHHRLVDQYKFDVIAQDGWKDVPEGPYPMMTIYHPSNAEMVASMLSRKWHERTKVLVAGENWVDLVLPENGKENALRMICEQVGVLPENVTAFGDNLNDKAMLEYAGYGVAVADAREEVIAIADDIVPGYKEDGVLGKLKEILSA